MKTIKGIYVSAEGFIHQLIGKPVQFFTDSIYSHVAIEMELDGELIGFEALGKGISKFTPGKYASEKVMEFHDIPIPDELYPFIEEEARDLLSGKYSYGLITDCVAGGIADFFGKEWGNEVAESFADKYMTRDCSECWVRLVRKAYPDYLPGRLPSAVTPEMARLGDIDLLNKLSGAEQ